MKLNNKGWGLKQMLWLSFGLLFFLLVAAYFVSKLYATFN